MSLEERAGYVKNFIKTHKNFSFRELLGSSHSKMETIVTFLVLLEMIKSGRLNVTQESRGDDIIIDVNGTDDNGEDRNEEMQYGSYS